MDATDDDWRIHGQERWLVGAVLHFAPYLTLRPTWDHDHCAFCWARFTQEPYPDTLQAGYTDDENFHWVCPQCFDDFQERFHFRLRPRIEYG
jgi:hypothetical protein